MVIGQVLKPHGVRGEMRVIPHTDTPERFEWLETVYIGESNPQQVAVESVRFHKNWILLKLVGYDDRDAVESLRDAWLQVTEDEAVPLAEGEYFLFQVVGLQVYSDADEYLGKLVDVLETRANNVFVVNGPDGELLLPDIDEVVQEIDFDNGRMIVHLLPGLRPNS
ncbi:MAG: 16S rRNA processing protein RimM [Ardenticatenaceae bacterium]|nr:16S rRNA processing protein RimM [Ardenticatenaceae bacterium]